MRLDTGSFSEADTNTTTRAVGIAFHNTYEPVTSIYRDLCPALASDGHRVTVVASRAQYRARETSLEDALAQSGVRVRYVGPGSGKAVSTRLGKTAMMLSYAIFGALDAVLKPQTVRVFLTQPPFFAALGLLLSRARAERYVCLCMDLYPDVLVANRVIKRDGILDRVLSQLAHLTLRRADAVVSIGEDMSRRLSEIGVDAKRIHYIPNWSSADDIRPIPSAENPLRSELGFGADDFVVMYSGNLGLSHSFDDLLATALAERDRSNLHFIFVGGGPRLSEVRQFRDKHALSNIRLLDYQPVSRLGQSLAIGDLHFISLRSGFGGLVVPSKVFGAMAAGRPILFQGEPDGELANMLSRHGIGTHCVLDDPETLRRTVLAYASDHERARREGARAAAIYRTNYSADIGIAKYRQVIQAVVNR